MAQNNLIELMKELRLLVKTLQENLTKRDLKKNPQSQNDEIENTTNQSKQQTPNLLNTTTKPKNLSPTKQNLKKKST